MNHLKNKHICYYVLEDTNIPSVSSQTAMEKVRVTTNSPHHGIFHVVASVGDHGYNGICPNRIVVHVVIVIHAWSH